MVAIEVEGSRQTCNRQKISRADSRPSGAPLA
jgi:hypothetical protein